MKSLRYEINANKIYKTVYFVERMRDTQIFMSNPAPDALPVSYNSKSTREDFTALIAKLPEVTRIGFVFDTAKLNNKIFLESEPYFTLEDIREGQTKFSKNVQLLKELPDHIKTIDFLCCNTTENSNWVKYYKLLPQIIGASNDQTGNINGNWKMETTGEDVKNIYFSSGIDTYANTLIFASLNFNTSSAEPIDLKSDCVLTDDDFNQLNAAPSKYFRVVKPIKITLKGNMHLTQANQCIVINSDDVVITGSKKHKILITDNSANGYPGLIMNGDGNDHNRSYSRITVQNITIHKDSTKLGYCGGWVAQVNYGFGSKDNLFTNCVNYARVTNSGGGIVGECATCDIRKCKNYGEITDNPQGSAGGIIGYGALNCNIYMCVNKGAVNSNNDLGGNAGLCGSGSSNITFTKCVNKGAVNSLGGIGSNAGLCGGYSNNITFTKCVNKGAISSTINSDRNSGFCGGNSNNITFTECVNKGDIVSTTNSDKNSGFCGGNSSNITFANCVNKGKINSLDASDANGGLSGGGSSNITFTKCVNKGDIVSTTNSDKNSGFCGGNSSNITFANCVNKGKINSLDASDANGGLSGGNSNYVTFTKCVNKGKIISDRSSKNAGLYGGTGFLVIFTKCINKGDIISSNISNYSGGLCGGNCNNITITKCINKGDNISTTSTYNGGLCGGLIINLTITKCVNTGNVKSSETSINNGGISGGYQDNALITNTINKGKIKSDETSTGNAGFIGGNNDYCSIINSYNTGKVSGGAKCAAFIGDIATCTYMSLSHSYSTYEPLVDIIPSNNLLIDTTKVSKKEGKWDSCIAAKCLIDGWVNQEASDKPWGISP